MRKGQFGTNFCQFLHKLQIWANNLVLSNYFIHYTTLPIWWSPMFLDFLTKFQMFWNNQESCESWLVGFGVSWLSKTPKVKPTNFFFWDFELSLRIYKLLENIKFSFFWYYTKRSFNLLNISFLGLTLQEI